MPPPLEAASAPPPSARRSGRVGESLPQWGRTRVARRPAAREFDPIRREAIESEVTAGSDRRPPRKGRRGGRIGVVKLLRARGGCLGVIRDFGRGRLRNVRGSCPTSVDPGMPEETRGTETSQYPEERKSTETPLVAASERGPA